MAQLRAELLIACFRGDLAAARRSANALGPHANDPLGDDGVRVVARIDPAPITGWMLHPARLTPALWISLDSNDRGDLIDVLHEAGATLPHDSFGQGELLGGAARRGNANVVRQLLAAGCDPNSIDEPWGCPVGETDSPVIFRSVRHIAIFRMLVDAGASLDSKNGWDESLDTCVERSGSPEVQELLARLRTAL